MTDSYGVEKYQSKKGLKVISTNFNSWLADDLGGFDLTAVDNFWVIIIDNPQRDRTCKGIQNIPYYKSKNKRVG